MNITLQDLFSKISAKIWCFFGFKHNFHQTLIYVAYAYHTWMESCACQLNFDTKMSGLAYVPKEQGILLTVRKNPGLQPDTASYLCINVKVYSFILLRGTPALHLNEAADGSCCDAGLGLVWRCYWIYMSFVCLIQKKIFVLDF